jgi:hypothetical protein
MAKYMCQCGMFLKSVKNVNKQGTNRPIITYKVLIVKTESHYKCPNGCELKNVTKYK